MESMLRGQEPRQSPPHQIFHQWLVPRLHLVNGRRLKVCRCHMLSALADRSFIALQLATLALLTQLTSKPSGAQPDPPLPVPEAAPQHDQYGSTANRYSSAPSLEDFCTIYGLTESIEKLKSLGFRPGDTPQDLAAVTKEDMKEANIRSLEWSRLKNAVEDYWHQLAAKGDGC
jgi:hypothetical protein